MVRGTWRPAPPARPGEADVRLRIAARLEAIGRGMAWIGIAIVAVLPFPIAYDAVARYLGHPTIWVFEVSLYALIVAGFLANAMALATGSHFRITLLGHLWPRARPWLDRFALLVTLIFAIVFIYASLRFVHYSWSFGIRSNSLLSTPQFLPQLALPIGGAALALQVLAQLLRDAMPSGEEGGAEIGD